MRAGEHDPITTGSTDGRRNRVELVPVGVVVLIGLPVLALRPAILLGTLNSPRALVITVGVTIAVVVWSALLRHLDVAPATRSLLVLAPILVAGLLWVRPYFTDTRVDEALPTAAADAVVGGQTAEAVPPRTEPTTRPASPPEPAGVPAGTRAGSTGAVAPTSETAAASPPAGPVAVSRGRFVGLDGHRAAGSAAVLRLEDGRLIVRLEDVDLQSVPEAYLHLVPRADAAAPGRRSIELGPLKGNVGSSNYRVPRATDVDPGGTWTVLVWCRPFASPVGAATQRPVR